MSLDDRDPAEVVRDGNEQLVRPFPIITTTVTDDGGEPVIETGPSQKIDISGQSISIRLIKFSTIKCLNKVKPKKLETIITNC